MDTLVRMFAPIGWWGWISRWFLFWLLINGLNIGVELSMNGALESPLPEQLLTTTIVATPFIILALALIGHLDRLQGQLAQLATTDMLTGLPNRRAFLDRAAGAAHDCGGVVLMLDVDHFKQVNDVYGHAVGDICLQAVARRIEQLVRQHDVVGRLGGEEFGIYLVDAPVEMAREIGERLARGVRVEAVELPQEVTVTISVGAVPSQAASTLAELLARADEALYEAKAAGRARLVLWEEAAAA
ncbi:GGDEF domain-containing protein [Cognatiyoonia sp. IB215182]|uniref:GGDEF domain-containing protein n=1 Tax=Cognatiyoonia sp. IB215182 TaxID=3097353 RepID=UPI002A0D7F1B|nr:GGDEF domain-containing protein [Cognatiyoonia sp. IB215182]MDX8353857.1 GGDEF domain-containing protein [Cognatiyoonia sp. IB215182]